LAAAKDNDYRPPPAQAQAHPAQAQAHAQLLLREPDDELLLRLEELCLLPDENEERLDPLLRSLVLLLRLLELLL